MLKEYEEKTFFWGVTGVRGCRWEEDWGEIFFFFFLRKKEKKIPDKSEHNKIKKSNERSGNIRISLGSA